MTDDLPQRLRSLPAVDRLARAVRDTPGATVGETESVAVARATLERRRAQLLAGATDDLDLVAAARERLRPSLRRVLNGTGVIIHTNLRWAT
jgi:L-seryl-tRNA(Ser) seleniumtransferase